MDSNQADEVKDFLHYNGIDGKHYWIGLSDILEEGKFVWSSTGAVPYYINGDPSYFNETYQADQDCVSIHNLSPNYYWNDRNCSTMLKPLCQTGKKKESCRCSSSPNFFLNYV
jgi:hypothetical protein